MSAEISQTVPEVVAEKLEGGNVVATEPKLEGGDEAAPAVPETAPEAAAPLAGGELEGGSKKRRKTRKDKHHKRGKYRSRASSKLRSAIRKLEETPGGEAVYVEGTAMKCRRGHRYSKKHSVCVKHVGSKSRKMRSYNRHRAAHSPLRASRRMRRSRLYSRHRKSKSRSKEARIQGGRTRSGRMY
jgi:hypothetical protein